MIPEQSQNGTLEEQQATMEHKKSAVPLETAQTTEGQLSRVRIGSANLRRRQQANEPKY